MKDSHFEYIGDEIFDFEKEALSFIQKKICTTLKISPSTFRDYKKHFIQDTNVIFEINTKVNKVDDTLEVLISPIKYAIRNEDIRLLDAILSGLTAAVSVNFFQGHHEDSKTISAIFGIIAALIKLGRDVLKGVKLSSEELLLLVILKRDGPIDINDLMKKLNEERLIDEDELLKLLNNLSLKKSLINTYVPLVKKAPNGKWFTEI